MGDTATISSVVRQGTETLAKIKPNNDSLVSEFSPGIQEAKIASLETALAQTLKYDQFQVATEVASADGNINKQEKKILDKIRSSESSVEIYPKIFIEKSAKKTFEGALSNLQDAISNLSPTRVNKPQAIRIAYEVANADSEIRDSETEVISGIFFKEN